MACHERNLIWPQSPMTTIRIREAKETQTPKHRKNEAKRDNCQHERPIESITGKSGNEEQ